MPSLYSRLFRLRQTEGKSPTEDFLTEAFAYLLETNPTLCQALVHQLTGWDRSYSYVVRTQQTYERQQDHERDSRPDMVLSDPSGARVMFIENKVDSGLQPQQLERYADHLKQLGACETALVYLTKHYDPQPARINGVPLIQLRWHQVGELLAAYPEDPRAKDLLDYLEELGLMRPTMWTPGMLSSFQAFRDSLSFLDMVLDEEVSRAFTATLAKPRQRDARLFQYARDGRYGHFSGAKIGKDWFEVFVGYRATEASDGSAFPQLYAAVGANTNAAELATLFASLPEELSDLGWAQKHHAGAKWSYFEKTASVTTILHQTDHASASQAWMLQAIQELGAFKKQTERTLPWRASGSDSELLPSSPQPV